MIVEVKVPAVGESISEGVLVRWLKGENEPVREAETLFELETDKVNAEVPAVATGTLRRLAKEGDTVAVGAVVGTIDTDGAQAFVRESEVTKPAAAQAAHPEPARAPEFAARAMSPLARNIAAEAKTDLSGVEGSGTGGRIMKKDVLAAVGRPSAGAPAPAPASPPGERRSTRQPMSPLRRRIAERLLESQQTTATLTTFNEADMSALVTLRNRIKDAFKGRHGVGLGFMSFFVKAAVEALKAFPIVNAQIDGRDIVSHHYYDIGIAVSTDRGLVVPVLRDADRLSFPEIERRIADFAQRARDGKLELPELQGGTFTITNGGVFGSLMATPILNPPQAGILGMHKIMDRPVAVGGQVVVRPMMYLALSYDHRLIDGRESVGFLLRVKECIEAPERMMLGL